MEALLTPRSQEHLQLLGQRLTDAGEDTQGNGQGSEAGSPWEQDYRSAGERDRDRILYCAAFQRLAYVTQVTAPEYGHAFHNRLAHSVKVAQVGRRNTQRLRKIAEAGHITGAAQEMVLSLDPDAVGASCLAHDLGHPPFGHIAEETLNSAVQEHVGDDGGFEGNAQSFRIVTRLAQRARGSGLDLCRQTLDGLLKYPWRWWRDDPLPPNRRERKWGYYVDDSEAYKFARRYYDDTADCESALPERSLEALIMEWADDLTYAVHDVDDFVRAGLIPLHRLADEDDDEFKRLEALMEEAKAAAIKEWPSYEVKELLEAVRSVAGGFGPSGAYVHTRALRRDMRWFGSELIARYLGAFSVENDAAKGAVRVRVDDEIEREVEALKLLVRVYVIRRPGLAVVQHGQQRVIEELFKSYFKASEEDSKKGGDRRIFPPGAKELLDSGRNDPAVRARIVADLISGLTETSAIQLHHRLTGGWRAPTLDATAHMA